MIKTPEPLQKEIVAYKEKYGMNKAKEKYKVAESSIAAWSLRERNRGKNYQDSDLIHGVTFGDWKKKIKHYLSEGHGAEEFKQNHDISDYNWANVFKPAGLIFPDHRYGSRKNKADKKSLFEMPETIVKKPRKKSTPKYFPMDIEEKLVKEEPKKSSKVTLIVCEDANAAIDVLKGVFNT